MKLLRHPAMVKMQWVQVTGKVLSMITDPVRPLGPELAHMGGEEIILGLHDIAGALLFLHDSVRMAGRVLECAPPRGEHCAAGLGGGLLACGVGGRRRVVALADLLLLRRAVWET